jgi:phenylacetic acid degradation operon negative regulatory protein
VAPGRVDVEQIVGGLGLSAHVRVFRAQADEPTDVGRLVRDAYDLDAQAARYGEFLARWDRGGGSGSFGDPLAAKLRLIADWLHLIRRAPRLPVQHLPPDWPAVRAQGVFRRLDAALAAPARTVAAGLLDTVPDESALA